MNEESKDIEEQRATPQMILQMMAQEAIDAVSTAKLIATERDDDKLQELVDEFNRHVAGLPFLLTMLRPKED